MHIILTGATGLVGSAVLNQLVTTYIPAGKVSQVTILARREPQLGKGTKGIEFVEHREFGNYSPDVLAKLKGADACIWALGISQALLSKEEYVEITEKYPLAAAKAFSTLNDKFNFVYVSGEGATTTPGTFTPFFGPIKGRTEVAVNNLMDSYPSLRTYSMRPGGVDSGSDVQAVRDIQQAQPGMVKKLLTPFIPVFRATMKGFLSPTPWLGKVLIEMAIGDGEKLDGDDIEGDGRIVPNKAAMRIWSEHL